MSQTRKVLKNGVGLVVVLCIAYFFYRAFEQNWASLTAQRFEPDYVAAVASGLIVAVLLLMTTFGWQMVINGLSEGRRLRFSESVATVNSSGLTKYIPGKIWSYALQVYWLASLGIRMSLVVYANLLNLVISLITCVVTGLVCLLLVAPSESRLPLLAALVFIVVADTLGMLLHPRFFGLLLPLLRKVRSDIQPIEFPMPLLLRLHVLHFAGAILSGVCIYVMCLAIGYPLSWAEAPTVVASSLLGDSAGTLAFVTPGGLGVREGVMYVLLNDSTNEALALVLPIASRLISMVVDLVLGTVSFLMLRKFDRSGVPVEPGSSAT